MPCNPSQVYQPEADSFLLLEAARAEAKPGDRVLEVGTGSGQVAAALVQDCAVIATDINPHAVFCARQEGLDVVRCDLFSGLRGTFDLVLFNPPYLPTQPEERIDDWLEHALDGGPAGRDVIGKFIKSVGTVLAPRGRVLLLVSSLTGLPEILALFTAHGFSPAVVWRQTVEGEELVVIRAIRLGT